MLDVIPVRGKNRNLKSQTHFLEKWNRLKWPLSTDRVRGKGKEAIPLGEQNHMKWQSLTPWAHVWQQETELVDAFVEIT